jgi:hypothetical protein
MRKVLSKYVKQTRAAAASGVVTLLLIQYDMMITGTITIIVHW